MRIRRKADGSLIDEWRVWYLFMVLILALMHIEFGISEQQIA